MMDHLRTVLLASLFFFSAQAFSGGFNPGYTSAHNYFDQLTAAIDSDFDTQLSYDELINGYHAQHLNKDLYKTIRLYLVNFEILQDPLTGSLSKDSIEQAELSGHVLEYHHEQEFIYWEAWLAQPERAEFADTYRQIFPRGLTSITPDNTLQKYFPDCVLIAALSSLASSETGKRVILNYFQHVGQKHVIIAFPGILRYSFDISLSSIKRHSHFAKTRDSGIWLPLLEEGYAHAARLAFKPRDRVALFKYHQYSQLDAVDENDVFRVLLSTRAYDFNAQFASREGMEQLFNAFNDNEKIAFAVISSQTAPPILRGHKGMHTDHAYAVIGYDEEKQVVYIRDPGGTSDAHANLISINQHRLSGGSSVFEITSHNYEPLTNGLDALILKPRLLDYLNGTFRIDFKGSDPVDVPVPTFLRDLIDDASDLSVLKTGLMDKTNELSAFNTGIIKMTLDQFMHTFNHIVVSNCGANQCQSNELSPDQL